MQLAFGLDLQPIGPHWALSQDFGGLEKTIQTTVQGVADLNQWWGKIAFSNFLIP